MSGRMARFSPAGGPIAENPPRFVWPAHEAPYTLEISETPDFRHIVRREANVPYNLYTPDRAFAPGDYYWRVSGHSGTQHFNLPESAPETPLPGRDKRYAQFDYGHPRLWLNAGGVKDFRAKRAADSSYCGFDKFYERSVLPRLEAGFPEEPARYPGDRRVIHLWRGNYMTCQQALCYVRSLSVAGVILEDAALLAKAKAALLAMAAWDTDGATSRAYNDECAFRVVYGLAYGYDWLYNEMTEAEREAVHRALYTRVKQIADHAIIETAIHSDPFNSHAVRSLGMALTPCCIALLEKDGAEDARAWLDYTLEYFSAVYTPWGGADGGWAEGPAYWMTGMAFVIEAMNHIKTCLGIDFYKRPFFQKTGEFMLRCNPPDTYSASFGDQSNMGRKPGAKIAFNMRQFAAASGNKAYQWYFNRVMAREAMESDHFSDKGWWDLYYDDMTFARSYGAVKEAAPSNKTTVSWFKDVGWVAVNKNAAKFDEHVLLLTKCSPYGSLSHSHADQGTFALFAYGEPLIINSGHYVGFGSSMHLNWRRQTISANTLLIDGHGQYGGMEKYRQIAANGDILNVLQTDKFVCVAEDATAAYKEAVPYLESFVREIYWINDEYALIADYVTLEQEGRISALFHSHFPFAVNGLDFRTAGEKAALECNVSFALSGVESITQTDRFDGVDEAEASGLEKQYHLSITTKPAKRHVLTVILRPKKLRIEN